MTPAPALQRVTDDQFSAMVERNRPKWINAVMRKGFDRDTASDITSDAILKAWRFLSKFQGQSALSTWMWSILFRQVQEHLRRIAVAGRSCECLTPELESTLTAPENTTQNTLIAQILKHADQLPVKEREVIHAYLNGEYNAPAPYVKILKHRAIIHLQKSLSVSRSCNHCSPSRVERFALQTTPLTESNH
jgi:RNA polymerase sigma factor (sigma-70 family)